MGPSPRQVLCRARATPTASDTRCPQDSVAQGGQALQSPSGPHLIEECVGSKAPLCSGVECYFSNF